MADANLKVMSFNIRYGLADDGPNRWEKRRELVIERIRVFEPDLLGMQECRDDEQAAFVRGGLPEYHFFGVRRGGVETALEMAPILFRIASFDLLESGCFWLSETPQVAGSKYPESTFARTATWAVLLHKASGRRLTFLNTHFDYVAGAIKASARQLRAWADRTVGPLVICGDFNADKASSAYRLLTGDGRLQDAWRQAHPGGEDEATFHGFGKPDQLSPIDWVLVSGGLQATRAEVDRTQRGGLFPSDHYPVGVELEWEG